MQRKQLVPVTPPPPKMSEMKRRLGEEFYDVLDAHAIRKSHDKAIKLVTSKRAEKALAKLMQAGTGCELPPAQTFLHQESGRANTTNNSIRYVAEFDRISARVKSIRVE